MNKSSYPEIKHVMDSIPSSEIIIDESLSLISKSKLSKKYLKKNFSQVIVLVEAAAHQNYKKYEISARKKLIKIISKKYATKVTSSQNNNKSELIKNVLTQLGPILIDFEFRIGQSRKQRGGHALEYIIKKLLERVSISSDIPHGKKEREKLNKMDLVVPDQNTALNNPKLARYLSCKRTLRERWKQTVPEKKKNWEMYLITLDDTISESKANDIKKKKLIAYVRDDLKNQSHLNDKNWIRKLSDLPHDLQFISKKSTIP